MIFTRNPPIDGEENTRQVDVTAAQITRWLMQGVSLDDVVPHLSSDDREFLSKEVMEGGWVAAFPAEEA